MIGLNHKPHFLLPLLSPLFLHYFLVSSSFYLPSLFFHFLSPFTSLHLPSSLALTSSSTPTFFLSHSLIFTSSFNSPLFPHSGRHQAVWSKWNWCASVRVLQLVHLLADFISDWDLVVHALEQLSCTVVHVQDQAGGSYGQRQISSNKLDWMQNAVIGEGDRTAFIVFLSFAFSCLFIYFSVVLHLSYLSSS